MGDRVCAMWARGHCSRGRRCSDRHFFICPDEKIPCDCPEKHDAFPRERRHCHRAQLGKHDGPLLGSFKNFCSAFYHVKETPEALQRESCLRCEASGAPSAAGGGLPKCSGKSVVCLARISTEVDDVQRDVYVARYMNCSSGALCAESSMLEDSDLRSAIEAVGGPSTRLQVYLNASPCHYSTDTRPAWSCTESLIRFQKDVLAPRRMCLEIVCSYPYRCHWDKASVPHRLASKIDNARLGAKLAREAAPGLVLRGFEEQDWEELVRYCGDEVGRDYTGGEGEGVFTAARRRARGEMDAFCQRCFSDEPPWMEAEGGGGEQGGRGHVGAARQDGVTRGPDGVKGLEVANGGRQHQKASIDAGTVAEDDLLLSSNSLLEAKRQKTVE